MDTTDLALKLAAVNAKLDRLLEAVARMEARMGAAEQREQKPVNPFNGIRGCRCYGFTTGPNPRCPIHGIGYGG